MDGQDIGQRLGGKTSPDTQVELGREADHDRIAGEVHQQGRILPAAQRHHQLQV
jgi:hypothetical protein